MNNKKQQELIQNSSEKRQNLCLKLQVDDGVAGMRESLKCFH